jgi:plastocyanin
MTKKSKVETSDALVRWALIAGIAAVALLGSYAFAATRGANSAQAATSGTPSAVAAPAGSSGCACCGTAKPAGPATTGKATAAGAVQKISVDVSKGYYDPSTIELKAGVPAEITFSQSSGCTGQVQSQDLGFSADLTQGPATVKVPALSAGTYGFACGMNMVRGTIVVK